MRLLGQVLMAAFMGYVILDWLIVMVFGRCLPGFRCHYCKAGRSRGHRGKRIWKEAFFERTLPGRDGRTDRPDRDGRMP